MSTLIHERVELARQGKNPYLITKMKSGWLVIGDVQPLDGYCVLLSDPVVGSINDLDEKGRSQFCLDMIRVGDAILKFTNSYRINYEILGNSEAALHVHIIPRYLSESADKIGGPAFKGYDWKLSRKYDSVKDAEFVKQMRQELEMN